MNIQDVKTDHASSKYAQFEKPYILGEFGAFKLRRLIITKAATANLRQPLVPILANKLC